MIADSPVSSILANCEMLAWALGEAKTGTIITHDVSGKRYELTLDLGGWDYEPLMSPGVIFPGTWGNVPPGETFCCPPPASVNGTICINGSVPGSLLSPTEEMVLRFRAGHLEQWCGDANSPGVRFLNDRMYAARQEHDENWNTFAELGIGLNPAITQLTGNALFDEKAIGTLHIAIGDNSGFGFSVHSGIHADLVTIRPSLQLDSRDIMTNGVLHFDSLATWRSEREIPRVDFDPETVVFVRPSRFVIRDTDEFVRRLQSGHRVGYVQISKGEHGRRLARLAEGIESLGRVTISEISRVFVDTFTQDELYELLSALRHYRVLAIEHSG